MFCNRPERLIPARTLNSMDSRSAILVTLLWLNLCCLISQGAEPMGPPFDTLADALRAPRSLYFGVRSDGVCRNSASYYRSSTPHLIFDVANYQVFASLSRNGLLRGACVLDDAGRFCGSSPLPFSIVTELGEMRLHELPNTQCDLLGNFFPLFTFDHLRLRIQQLVFAPSAADRPTLRPRSVIVCFRLENHGAERVVGTLQIPPHLQFAKDGKPATRARPEASSPARWPETAKKGFYAGYEAIQCLDDPAASSDKAGVKFSLSPGATRIITFACLVGTTSEEIVETANILSKHSVLTWLNQTWADFDRRFGALEISDDHGAAEALVRLGIEACQSVLFSSNRMRANSDGAQTALALLDSETASDYAQTAAPGLLSQEPARSIYNCLFGPAETAANYYRLTGDTEFFRKRPAMLAAATNTLADAFACGKRFSPSLVSCGQIWDSLARGDWHFGSNLLLWHFCNTWSEIAFAAYGDAALAKWFTAQAVQIRSDINRRLVSNGPLGAQYFEGANHDGTTIPGHDGEEGISTIAACYQFCRPDEPKLLRYKQRAITDANPLFNQGLEGINWLDCRDATKPWSGWRAGPTSPGWCAALAGASNVAEVRYWLRKLATVTDADGSLWWWPYSLTNRANLADVRRRDSDADVGKCGYAASLYTVLFYSKLLGVSVDRPAQRLLWRPLLPWEMLDWRNCRIGPSAFDFVWKRTSDSLVAEITNLNQCSYAVEMEMPLPPGKELQQCVVDGRDYSPRHGTLYGRPAILVDATIRAGEALKVQLRF